MKGSCISNNIKEERKVITEKNLTVMPAELSSNSLRLPIHIDQSMNLDAPISKKRKLNQVTQDEKSSESQI